MSRLDRNPNKINKTPATAEMMAGQCGDNTTKVKHTTKLFKLSKNKKK